MSSGRLPEGLKAVSVAACLHGVGIGSSAPGVGVGVGVGAPLGIIRRLDRGVVLVLANELVCVYTCILLVLGMRG